MSPVLALFASFILASASLAEPDARPLASFDQVRALCRSLKQLDGPTGRLFRADIPGAGFVFGRYRQADKELELDGDRPLRAAAGSLYLDVRGIDDVAFRATEEQRDDWARRKGAGKLTLSVVFEPSAEGCRGSLHAHQARLSGVARSWQLIGEQGKVVAAADEDGRPLERLEGPRAARVRSVALENEAPVPDEGKARLRAAQSALEQCAAQAQRPGSIVLSFAARAGALHDINVALDGLHDDAVAGCMTKALAGTTLADNASGRGMATIAVE